MVEGGPEYQAIQRHYYGRRQHRSGVPYMEHIREGLFILGEIGASPRAARAFCLHPIVQSDVDLSVHWASMSAFDGHIVALAMEYRRVANAYLSFHEAGRARRRIHDIELGPLPEVRHMLIADKVQNYKDFLHFQDRYSNAKTLDRYFSKWLERLGVDRERFEAFREQMKPYGIDRTAHFGASLNRVREAMEEDAS